MLSHFPQLYDLLARQSYASWTRTLLQPHQPQYLEGHLSGAAHWPLEGVVTVSAALHAPGPKSLLEPQSQGGSVAIRKDKEIPPKEPKAGPGGAGGAEGGWGGARGLWGGGGGWGAAGSCLGRLPHSPSWPRRLGPMDGLCGSTFWVRKCPGLRACTGQPLRGPWGGGDATLGGGLAIAAPSQVPGGLQDLSCPPGAERAWGRRLESEDAPTCTRAQLSTFTPAPSLRHPECLPVQPGW